MLNHRIMIRIAGAVAPICLLASTAFAASEEAPTEAEVEEIVGAIEKAYYEAQEALEAMPQERFDRFAVLEEIDLEVDSIAAWVKESTRWVPYEGVLRGADGVLLDRQGNSLDRSLLLTELLLDAGHEARLVRGRLDEAAAIQLLEAPRVSGPPAHPTEAQHTPDARAAGERASADAAALAELVPSPQTAADSGLALASTDHWWVEAKLDSGWSTIDPLLVGPLAGIKPERIEHLALDDLSESLFHQVTLRVVIERWEQGETVEEIPLEHTVRPSSRIYHDLELQFVPFGFDAAPEGSDAAVEAAAVAETTRDWLPLIRQGEDQVQQKGFGTDGHLENNPAKPTTHRKFEDAIGGLGGLGGGKKKPEPLLTACWIEYELTGPGRQPQVVRRELFDLIGPARRRQGDLGSVSLDETATRVRGQSLMGFHRILITGNDLPPVAFERASHELWAMQAPQIAAFVRLLHNPDAEEPLQRFHRQPLAALDLLELAVARSELSPHPTATFLAAANILTAHFVVEIDETLDVRRAFDLVANEVGVITKDSISPWRVRLDQGVLDTVLEAAMNEPSATPDNTAELFALRGGATGDWRVADGPLTDPQFSEVTRARMTQAVDAGRIVVAPGKVDGFQSPAWWEIDPATGTTLGIGSRGWGQAGATDVTTRTLAGGFTTQATRKFTIKLSCRALHIYLQRSRMIFMMRDGTVVYRRMAMRLLAKYGCSVIA